jgi:nucleotide-binding universal stress UspA family protein
MGKILCATRGGEDSYQTQEAAIALAKERGDELVFLFVADASFLDRIAAPVVVDVDAELERMGRFEMAMACRQAAAQGVQAQIVVRHGRLRTELAAAALELGATLVVLGRPREATAVFHQDALASFAGALQAQTGAEVRIA